MKYADYVSLVKEHDQNKLKNDDILLINLSDWHKFYEIIKRRILESIDLSYNNIMISLFFGRKLINKALLNLINQEFEGFTIEIDELDYICITSYVSDISDKKSDSVFLDFEEEKQLF